MNARISVFVICVETIIYLILYNLHDCTFNLASKICFSDADLKIVINYEQQHEDVLQGYSEI